MPSVSLATIKNWFRTGFKPTQAQFWDTWDSFWHKDSVIPATAVQGVSAVLPETVVCLGAAFYDLPVGRLLDKVVVEVATQQTFKIGTSAGGAQVFDDVVFPAWQIVSVSWYAPSTTTRLHFTAANATIKLFLR